MKIGASLLSIPILSLKEKTEVLLSSGIDYLHIDIMDGNFVPNLAFTPSWTNQISLAYPSVETDLHYMTSETACENLFDDFQKSKPKRISFHLEAVKDPNKWIKRIVSSNCKAGIAICPETPLTQLSPYLCNVSFVLLMSVNPGFGGQIFIKNTYKKIEELVKIRESKNYHFEIQVDGGIKTEHAVELKKLGVDLVVIGSYLINSDNPSKIVDSINKK